MLARHPVMLPIAIIVFICGEVADDSLLRRDGEEETQFQLRHGHVHGIAASGGWVRADVGIGLCAGPFMVGMRNILLR